jgi:hypothetical protein
MSVFSKLAGTISSFFQLGGPGSPGLNNNAGVLEAKNSANNAFVNLSVATPTTANHAATKAYVDTGGASAAIMEVRFALGTTTASSVNTVPANAVISSVQLDVTTLYSGGTTISIGQTGSVSLLMATGDNVPTVVNLYDSTIDVAWGASALAVLATVAGAPSVGAAQVIVKYSEPLN